MDSQEQLVHREVMLQQGGKPREDQRGSERGRTRGGALDQVIPHLLSHPHLNQNGETDRCD